jgi:hypothetical protein
MRMQIELPESDVHALKTLMGEANIETYKDLFKNALVLLYWAVREVKNGRIIASIRAEEVDQSNISCKQIVMPVLERLAESKDPAEQPVILLEAHTVGNAKEEYQTHMPGVTKALGIGKKIES